ncbi:Transcriptional regulatory protein DesR [Phycisphaerales bacterium]|nr:Transcriptional regulatory protein DesR [Phycisphaerales bacterium]
MISVLLVDDQERLLLAWEKLLAAQPDMRLAGTLPAADRLIEVVSSSPVDVVILDLSMPGRSPLSAIRDLVEHGPGVRAIVLSAHADPAAIQAAFDAGVWAFVDKLSPPSHMLDVIRRVAAGEAVFPAHMSHQES